MKVVYVTHQYPPEFTTGTELYADRLARSLRDRLEHDVHVYTFAPEWRNDAAPFREEEGELDGLPVTRVGMSTRLHANQVLQSYYNVHVGKSFGKALDRLRPDVVHVFHPAFHGVSILEEAWLREIPVVVNLMDFWFICPTVQLVKTKDLVPCAGPAPLDCLECLAHTDGAYSGLARWSASAGFDPWLPDEPGESGARWNQPSPHAAYTALAERPTFLREALLTRASRIIAPSESLRDEFVRHGYARDRLEIVRYGVDPVPDATPARAASETLRLGFIGSLNPPKGAHVLIDAVRELAGDLTLDVYGDPSQFPDYSADAHARARGDDRIRFLGRVEPSAVPGVLAGLDALVVPSIWPENTPFVVLEARAAGRPVVASSVAGIAEVVEDGADGLLFAAGDVDELRERLRALLDGSELRGSLGAVREDHRTLLDNAHDFARMYVEVTQ